LGWDKRSDGFFGIFSSFAFDNSPELEDPFGIFSSSGIDIPSELEDVFRDIVLLRV